MKKFMMSLSMMLLTLVNANAASLTPAQEKAQHNVIFFLQKENYNPSVDTSDNSVCFRRNNVFYWITFDEESPILYTIHRKAFKVGGDDGYRRYASIIAANEVNCKTSMVKLTVGASKVDIAVQMYANNTDAFTSVFNSCYSKLNGVADDFKKEYEKAKAREDSTMVRRDREIKEMFPPSVLKDKIVNVSFRLIDNDGKTKSDYDVPMRSYNAHFIQPRLEFTPYSGKEPTSYNIRIKVTKPDGKVICIPNKTYTAESKITMSKSKKNQFFEIDEFGSAKDGYWKAGEYKVEFEESGSVFFTTTFTLL